MPREFEKEFEKFHYHQPHYHAHPPHLPHTHNPFDDDGNNDGDFLFTLIMGVIDLFS